jgi:beta-glucuronidase
MKKVNLVLIFILFCFGAYPQPNFITNVNSRTSLSLNGKWSYVMDQYETGQAGFAPLYRNLKKRNNQDRVEYSFDLASTLWVPGSWNSQKEALYYYEGSLWYRRMFDFTPQLKNSRVFVYVGAANYKTQYSINGTMIGEHEGGFTPFSFEVTDKIKDKDNYLILGVSNRREKDYIPGMVTDWYNHGGITRDVKIVEVPQTFIDDYTIYLDKKSLNAKNRIIKGKIALNGSNYPSKAVVEIPELAIKQEISVDKEGKATFSLASNKLQLWSPENPKLYNVKIAAGEDVLTDKVGFRVIETQGTKILLNGKPIFLRGISVHDENPLRRDRANSVEDARLILNWAKELGCNFVRLAHYPHQENILLQADEMGILLWEELPLYWGIDWKNDVVLEKAKTQFSELIRRDKNRASSIVWSVANETGPTPERNKFLTEVIHHVRSLDSTRLLSAASKKDAWKDNAEGNTYMVSDPISKELDIISFNEYQGWYGGSPLLCREKNFKIGYEKPVIISEFGAEGIQGLHSDSTDMWSEEFQEWVYKENIAMFKRVPGLAGMTPWILTDFQSPLRQLPNAQDGWNRKGLISEKGAKKKAFYILKNYYNVVDKEWMNYPNK